MWHTLVEPDMTLAQTSHTCARDAEKVLSCCLILRSVHTSCCDDMAGNTTATTRLGPSIQSAGSLGHAMASERGATPERTWPRHCGPWRLDITGTRRPRMLRGGLVAAVGERNKECKDTAIGIDCTLYFIVFRYGEIVNIFSYNFI